jgi:hypothetical protein
VNEAQHSIRVSDRDRERYQQVSTTAYAEGRLDESEFEGRLTRVLDAKFEADLAPLVTDLPAGDHLIVADVDARQQWTFGLTAMTSSRTTTASE